MTRLKCSRCGQLQAISSSTTICEACLYAEALGPEAAARQRTLAEAERARQAERKAAQKGKVRR